MPMSTQRYMTMTEAACFVPNRPHRSTVVRWATRGLRGLRLQTKKIGGRRYTTPAWIEEFVAATGDSLDQECPPKAIDTAAAALKELRNDGF
jgi:hypothetical protein